MADEAFGGFTPAAIQLVAVHAVSNDRPWFHGQLTAVPLLGRLAGRG